MKQKIYHIIIFLLFWFCGVAYSQNPKADILQQDLSGLFDNLSMIGILGEDCSRIDIGEFYQFNLSSCIRQQNSLTAQFVSFSLANLANIFYPPPDFYNN